MQDGRGLLKSKEVFNLVTSRRPRILEKEKAMMHDAPMLLGRRSPALHFTSGFTELIMSIDRQNVCLRGAAFQMPEQTPDGPLPCPSRKLYPPIVMMEPG